MPGNYNSVLAASNSNHFNIRREGRVERNGGRSIDRCSTSQYSSIQYLELKSEFFLKYINTSRPSKALQPK